MGVEVLKTNFDSWKTHHSKNAKHMRNCVNSSLRSLSLFHSVLLFDVFELFYLYMSYEKKHIDQSNVHKWKKVCHEPFPPSARTE